MKLYVFTKKDIDRFLIECNFTPDEERLFRLRCQSALLTTAMASQTQQLINAINPAPIPAYQVPNPNTFYGCGCNTGCNC